MIVRASGASFCSSRRRGSFALIVGGARMAGARMTCVETVGYGGCAGVGPVLDHGISSESLLMGCPSAILVRMSLR